MKRGPSADFEQPKTLKKSKHDKTTPTSFTAVLSRYLPLPKFLSKGFNFLFSLGKPLAEKPIENYHPFDNLPPEIIKHIFSYLDNPKDQLNTRAVCEKFRALLNEDPNLLKTVLDSPALLKPPYNALCEKIWQDQQEEIDYLIEHHAKIQSQVGTKLFQDCWFVFQQTTKIPLTLLLRHLALNQLNSQIIQRNQKISYSPLYGVFCDLHHCHLTRLPQPIEASSIDVSDNYLKTLPQLPVFLTDLNGSNNRLQSLPPLTNCDYLRSLDVANNRLQSLPSLTNCRLLIRLNVENNELKELPSEITRLLALKRVQANRNYLQSVPTIPNGEYWHSEGCYPYIRNETVLAHQKPRPVEAIELDQKAMAIQPRQKRAKIR